MLILDVCVMIGSMMIGLCNGLVVRLYIIY